MNDKSIERFRKRRQLRLDIKAFKERRNIRLKGNICGIPLDKSVKTDIIKTDTLKNLDGAPKGNKNAAGPHKKKSSVKKPISSFKAEDYTKAIKGIKSSNGIRVKVIDPHLYKQAAKRTVYPESVALAIRKGKTSPGKNGMTLYEYRGTTVVFDDKRGLAKTVIYKGKK